MIRLFKCGKSFRRESRTGPRFWVLYDYSAGFSNRYTVFVETSEDPVVIGRELKLHNVRELLAEYEAAFQGIYWGPRRTALRIAKQVQKARRERFFK